MHRPQAFGDRLRSFAQPWELVAFLWVPALGIAYAFWYELRARVALEDLGIFRTAALAVVHGHSPYVVPNAAALVRSVEDAKKSAEKLLAGGIRRVIITLGANGSLLAGRDLKEHLPAFPVKAVDSTGAGDAFIGSFAVFLAEGLPEREAVRRANLYAGLSTTGVGTQKSFYDRERFDAEWAAQSKTNSVSVST